MKTKLLLSPFDMLIERWSWASLFVLWGFSFYCYFTLPNIIPTHFNVFGEVDGVGSKVSIFILPLISTTITVLLTILNSYPHVFNYPTPVTAQNAEKQYRNATRLLRVLKLLGILIFIIISALVYLKATQKIETIGNWFLPLVSILVFVPVLIYVI